MITYSLANTITGFGDLSLNNTMGAQLVAQTVSGNYVVSNTTFAPNISGGFSISLWFSCSGQLNKTGTLISLPPSVGTKGLEIDISGTNMIYTVWNYSSLPAVTTSLAAYFPLTNTTQESVSGLSVTAATTVTYSTIGGKTGIVCTTSSGYGTSGTVNTSTSIVNYNIPTFTLPFTTNGVSFSLWFYPTAITSSNQILFNLANNTYNTNAIFLIITTSSQIYLTYANYTGGNYAGGAYSNVTISNNNWYHLVFTLSSGLASVCYVNNTSYDTSSSQNQAGSTNGFNITTNSSFAIGCDTGNAYNGAGYKPPGYNSFTGNIAKLAVYNTVLSAQQVTALYNAG